MWLTVLALPILVLDNVSRTDARAQPTRIELAAEQIASSTTARPTTTSTTTTTMPVAQPAVAASPTTAAPATTAKPKPTTTTTTTAKPTTTTTTTTAPPPKNIQTGGASWYDWHPGECAHLTLAFGTVVTVTNNANGATTTCVVSDRGPHVEGRIIDLDRTTFSQIANTSDGVISVTITW